MSLDLLLSTEMLWLEFGVLLILIEFYIGGIGIFLIGLGAVTVGFFVIWQLISEANILGQFVTFFAASAIWVMILWRPFKNLKLKGDSEFSNIVGDEAIVESAKLTKDKTGLIRWSGTTVNAKISQQANIEKIEKGNIVRIVNIQKNVFIVEPN